ncbi:MAG: lysoplasmalogenase [Flavobacteriaceae bacterium]
MKTRIYILVFLLVLLADLVVIGGGFSSELRFVTKPAIIITLLIYLLKNSGRFPFQREYLTLALLFSLIGDVLLLFGDQLQWHFIGGLLAFLLAHLMYISRFFRLRNLRSGNALWVSLPLLLYAGFILNLIRPNLNELLPYVVAYMVVLLFMVLATALRKKAVVGPSYFLVLSGALLFMVSDSLLAINKFYTPIMHSDLVIMLTYGLAQLLIIHGALEGVKYYEKLR